MNLLAFETSGKAASVAVMKEGRIVGELTVSTRLNHSEKLMPMIDELLKKTEMSIGDMDYVAVSAGPGSFTGLRIGISTAKGLALALDVPVVAVSSLEVLANNLAYADLLVCPLVDARRNQVYSGVFRWEGSEIVRVLNEDTYDMRELLFLLKKKESPVVFLGEDIDKFKDQIREALGEKGLLAAAQANFPRGASVAGLALGKIEAGEVEDAFSIRPIYLRQAEAERQYEERMGKKS